MPQTRSPFLGRRTCTDHLTYRFSRGPCTAVRSWHHRCTSIGLKAGLINYTRRNGHERIDKMGTDDSMEPVQGTRRDGETSLQLLRPYTGIYRGQEGSHHGRGVVALGG